MIVMKRTSKHFNLQNSLLFHHLLRVSILQSTPVRTKLLLWKLTSVGERSCPGMTQKNNHVSCVSSLSLRSHLLKQSVRTPQSAQTSAIIAAQKPLYATSQLGSALFSLVIGRITQAISFIFTNSGGDRPRITRGQNSRQQLTEDFPKA